MNNQSNHEKYHATSCQFPFIKPLEGITLQPRIQRLEKQQTTLIANLVAETAHSYYELVTLDNQLDNLEQNIANQLFQSARADYMEVLLTQRDAP